MAQFTVELGDVVKSGLKVFNFPYEFYDETKKGDFEQKFIDHFLFREIGQETVGRFQHYLKCKCNETLPFYNMLFRTALIDYEKTINYNLSDTYTRTVDKTDNVTANAIVDGTKADTTTNSNTLNRNVDTTITGNKTNALTSTTNHNEDITFNKNDTVSETGTIDNAETIGIDGKKVSSDTPTGLLALGDIKTNVYASKADIEDTTTTTTDAQTSTAQKTNTSNETTGRNSFDSVSASSHDVSNDTNNENVAETNNGSLTSNGSFGNVTDTTQNTTGSENETSTRIMKGSYGVITEADMLEKHINLQRTLTTILTKFFDDCEDLFMGIF